MGRQTGCWNHKMELASLRHHFILIDSNNLSTSKDPFVRNVFQALPIHPVGGRCKHNR